MEYDQPTPPIWVVDSPHSHDSLDFEFPSDEAILEVMASVDKPKEDVMHRSSILPYLEQMRVNMMICDSRQGAFSRASSEMLRLDHFEPQISFLELATNYLISIKPKINVSYLI
jgi:hypothetical protein